MTISIAHIVNPVLVGPASDLAVAQPVTFETMRRARRWSEGNIDVAHYSAQYPEDRAMVPTDFWKTQELERSILDFGDFHSRKKLPLIGDILSRLQDESSAEYFVYTNVDIALMPSFYESIAALIELGHDAIMVNRRTVEVDNSGSGSIPLMYMDIGDRHPGRDCFIFRRSLLERFRLANVVIGAPWIGNVLSWNLAAFAENFVWIKDGHLTFHIGNDQSWRKRGEHDELNRREALSALAMLREDVGESRFTERVLPYVPNGRRLRGKDPSLKGRIELAVRRRLRDRLKA